jgi:hypothetical protein
MNRTIYKKKHDHFGDKSPAPNIYFNPGVTESGLCYYGQSQDYLMPDYSWQHPRPGKLQIGNPYQPLPDHQLWPNTRPVMKRVIEYDDSRNETAARIIRDPYLRGNTEKGMLKPAGKWTMHGYREYKAKKQVDPDLEEALKLATLTQY